MTEQVSFEVLAVRSLTRPSAERCKAARDSLTPISQRRKRRLSGSRSHNQEERNQNLNARRLPPRSAPSHSVLHNLSQITKKMDGRKNCRARESADSWAWQRWPVNDSLLCGLLWARFRAWGRVGAVHVCVSLLPPVLYWGWGSHPTGPWCESDNVLCFLLLAGDNKIKKKINGLQ